MKVKVRNPKIEEDNFEDFEADDDEMGRREISVGDDKFTIIQREKFALWDIKKDGVGGPLPEDIRGSFTSVHAAEQAIKIHLGKKNG